MYYNQQSNNLSLAEYERQPVFQHKYVHSKYLIFTNISYAQEIFELNNQGRSQNLKEVTQNFTEVFNIDDVTANDIIQRN